MKKSGRFCISFGMDDPQNGDAYDSSSGGGGSSNSPTRKKDNNTPPRLTPHFPPGFSGPDPNGDGVVYTDMQDPRTKEVDRIKTKCCEFDVNFLEYMKSLVGQRANYAIIGQSCRSFSQDMFNYAQDLYEEDGCK